MLSNQGKRFLLPALIICLTILVAVVPDIVSDDMKAWCLDTFGPSYAPYLIGIFILGTIVLVRLSGDWGAGLSASKTTKVVENANISWSIETARLVREAKADIQKGDLEGALKHLFDVKSSVLDTEISLLSVRLAQYQQESRLGTLTQEQKETSFNRISKDILDLIKAIENYLAEGEKENLQLRDAFRQRYRNRLSQKLALRQPVNLRRFATTEGTSEQVAATFIPYNNDEIREEITKTFQEAHGRLLIVGQPGAGKTTLLLQLADRLFDLEEDALPLVLNLATWQSSFRKLETWLETVLAVELGTNQAGVRAVLCQSNLILLLDGLDELKEDEVMNSCLVAIADYGMMASRRFVITCRIEEYKRVKEDARVYLEIEVGSLKGDQLVAELSRVGHNQPEFLPLLQAIQKNPLLQRAVETPFYFNTLQLLFAGRLPVFTAEDLESLLEEIKQKFVSTALQGFQNKNYLPKSAAHWLSFLAFRMSEHNKVVFELRDLQYNWWKTWPRKIIVTANRIDKMLDILIFVIVFEAALGVIFGTGYGVIIGISVSITYLLAIRRDDVNIPKIFTRDSVRWSMKAYIIFVWDPVRSLLFEKTGYLLTFLLIFFLASLFASWLFNSMIIAGIFVLTGILVGGVMDMLERKSFDFIQIKSPYQRFYASMRVLHFSILQHWHLRRLLYKKGLLPLDLVTFLNEMTARHLMETDGATWRFRHGLIQDWFAEEWVKEHPEDGQPAKQD